MDTDRYLLQNDWKIECLGTQSSKHPAMFFPLYSLLCSGLGKPRRGAWYCRAAFLGEDLEWQARLNLTASRAEARA